jgi:hypothetical protein
MLYNGKKGEIMASKKHSKPWNLGKTGLEAGWTPQRREHQRRLQTQWLEEHPEHFANRGGPSTWKTGPDPEVRQHYYRFLKARNQARFWQQPWTLKWEDYLDLFKTAPGEWSRDAGALNLVRVDTRKGWHIWNVQLMTRIDAMRRPTKGRHRIRPRGLHSNSVQDPNTGKWSRRK